MYGKRGVEILFFLLDAVLVVLLVLFIWRGIKKGVAKSFAEFIGTIIAGVLAILIASFLAHLIFNTLIRSSLESSIAETIRRSAGTSVTEQVEAVIDALPGFVSNFLSAGGDTFEKISGALNGAVENAAVAVTDLAAPVFIGLIRVILVFVLFVLLMFLVKLLARGVETVFGLVLLNQVDSFLGGLLAILKCMVFLLIICAIIKTAIPMMQHPPGLLSQESIDQTFVFKYIYNFNPFSTLLRLL